MTIRLDPGRVFRYLLLCVAFLLALNVLAVVLGYRLRDNPYAFRVAHLDSELSVGTWFAQTILLAAAVLLATIGAARHRGGDRWSRHWLGLAVLALYASIDEGSTLHEQSTRSLRRLTGSREGFFGPTWVIAGIAAAVAVLIVYLRFLRHLPSRTRSLFLLGAAVFLSGAIGAEIVSVEYASRHRIRSYGYQTLAAAEEVLELVGACILVFALLDYIRRDVPPVTIRGETPPAADE